jgi:hypothetical protein
VGLTFDVTPSVVLGAEYWARGHFVDAAEPDPFVSGTRHYAGPTAMIQSTQAFASLGAYVRWDRFGESAQPDDPWGKVWLRVMFGLDL